MRRCRQPGRLERISTASVHTAPMSTGSRVAASSRPAQTPPMSTGSRVAASPEAAQTPLNVAASVLPCEHTRGFTQTVIITPNCTQQFEAIVEAISPHPKPQCCPAREGITKANRFCRTSASAMTLGRHLSASKLRCLSVHEEAWRSANTRGSSGT